MFDVIEHADHRASVVGMWVGVVTPSHAPPNPALLAPMAPACLFTSLRIYE